MLTFRHRCAFLQLFDDQKRRFSTTLAFFFVHKPHLQLTRTHSRSGRGRNSLGHMTFQNTLCMHVIGKNLAGKCTLWIDWLCNQKWHKAQIQWPADKRVIQSSPNSVILSQRFHGYVTRFVKALIIESVEWPESWAVSRKRENHDKMMTSRTCSVTTGRPHKLCDRCSYF